MAGGIVLPREGPVVEQREPKRPENSVYNEIDTLMFLNRNLWNEMVDLWSQDQENFLETARTKHGLQRTVAYTYWHAIWWGMEIGYPSYFSPGNEYIRKHPEHALDLLADRA